MRSSSLRALLAVAAASLPACDAVVTAQVAAQAETKTEPGTEPGAPASGPAAPAGGPAATAASVAPKVERPLRPDQLDLDSINFLMKKGKVKDGAALEKQINDPKEKLHSIDLDGDGKLDRIQLVEVRRPGDEIVFELRVIPSSQGKEAEVLAASIDFEPDTKAGSMLVRATYAPRFVGHDTLAYDYLLPIVVQNDVIVVQGGPPFFRWLFSVRPAYVGVVVVGKAKVKAGGADDDDDDD